jgi:hypothetical protein
MFRQCQRQWYFKTRYANATAGDPRRREAYRLSKLQSVSAWRGTLVDQVISEHFVEAIRQRRIITGPDLVKEARQRFDRQSTCALSRRAGDTGSNNENVAFRCVEYGQRPSGEELSAAWDEVESSLNHLFAMEGVQRALRDATWLVAQRPLRFSFADVTVQAVPDVIAFPRAAPPLIVDWKVHTFGNRDYRLQLALYGLALLHCKPHSDFPADLTKWAETDLRLVEAQLISGIEHEYHLSGTDVEVAEDYIAATATEMLEAKAGLSNTELRPEDFAVTTRPSLCQRCSFLKLCWENADGPPRDERLPNHELSQLLLPIPPGRDRWPSP